MWITSAFPGEVPVALQAPILAKVLDFYTNIPSSNVEVYVIKSSDMAAGFNTMIGKSKINSVKEGADPPTSKPSMIYCNDESKIDQVVQYARANKLLTMTGNVSLLSKGIVLGVDLVDGKPKINLNVKESKDLDIQWNPAMLKVAVLVNN
jgi:hypothetical protein